MTNCRNTFFPNEKERMMILGYSFRKKVINYMWLGIIRIPFILLNGRRQELYFGGMKGSPDSYRIYEKTDILKKDIWSDRYFFRIQS